MFHIQLQLRILCNHGTFQHRLAWRGRNFLQEKEDAICSISATGGLSCSACRQNMPMSTSSNIYRTYADQCPHVLCSECIEEHELSGTGREVSVTRCPICEITKRIARDGSSEELHGSALEFQERGFSTKMEALVTDVAENLASTKSIIFSCWTKTLTLVGDHLNRSGIAFERIDGDCTLSNRERILRRFYKSKDLRVLIITTGTGAYGLNLTAANRIFIVEPQWNPSIENQAIARAVRYGQRDSVLVTRYIIENTVEQSMRDQQRRKLELIEFMSPSTDDAVEA